MLTNVKSGKERWLKNQINNAKPKMLRKSDKAIIEMRMALKPELKKLSFRS